MISRSVMARIIKLEAIRRRPDEVLLVWRGPDADVRAAVAGAKFEPGDKVICAEWFDGGPLPAPRWYRERVTSSLDEDGQRNLNRSVDRVTDDDRDPAFALPPFVPSERIVEMTDNALLHACLGVAT